MTTTPQETPSRLMLIVVRDEARKQLVNCLLEANFRVTEFSSTGGFFRRGNTTLLIGMDAARVNEALSIIRTQCPTPENADEHTATVFVLPARQITEI